MQRATLSEDAVKSLPTPEDGNRVTYFAGAKLQGKIAPGGFGVRVTAGGSRAFVLNYRVNGRERRFTIGEWQGSGQGGVWSVIAAIDEAIKLRRLIDKGNDPQAAKAQARTPEATGKTVAMVLDDFIVRYATPKLRGGNAIKSAFDRLVKPRIGELGIHQLRRSHVAEMLDKIEDTAGPVAADRTRAYFRKALGWYGERDDQFNLGAAIVKVQPRAEAASRARSRILSDDEIRTLWPALDGQGTFGALVKALLLTGQRRGEIAGMARAEIDKAGLWVIPASRYKTKREHSVPLSVAARDLIDAQPTAKEHNFVFPSSAGTAFTGFGKSKTALDAAVLAAMKAKAAKGAKVAALPNWTLHDLRRTSKTLMQRAGVRPDISERVLGHVISGVEGTYDRHSYADEKRDALEKLAALVELILNPPANNVTTLDDARRRA